MLFQISTLLSQPCMVNFQVTQRAHISRARILFRFAVVFLNTITSGSILSITRFLVIPVFISALCDAKFSVAILLIIKTVKTVKYDCLGECMYSSREKDRL